VGASGEVEADSATEVDSGVVEVLVRGEDSGVGIVEIVEVGMGAALVKDMDPVQTEVMVIVAVLEDLVTAVVVEVVVVVGLEVIEGLVIAAEAISAEDRQAGLAAVTMIVVMEEIEDIAAEDTEALSVADTVEDVE